MAEANFIRESRLRLMVMCLLMIVTVVMYFVYMQTYDKMTEEYRVLGLKILLLNLVFVSTFVIAVALNIIL